MFHRVCQWIVQLFLRVVFRCIFRFEVVGQKNVEDLKGPLIITVNHTSWLDPFIAGAALPLFWDGAPVRFATWHKYYYSLHFFIFLWMLDCFPIRKGVGLERALEIPLRILKEGGVLMIFPEGKRRHLGRPKKGRRGVSWLAMKSSVPILPIKIEGVLGLTLKNFWKRKIWVKIGKTFFLPDHLSLESKIDEATDYIMGKMKMVE